MKSVLTILTAFVLLIFEFSFSSCKGCDKEESKSAQENANQDANTNNTPSGTTTSNDTLDGSNTNGASDGNSKSTTPSGDNSTGLGGKKGGGAGATGAGGKSDGTSVLALISLEDKIKVVKELVLKVQAVRDKADVAREETIDMARLGNNVTAQEKLKVLVAASGDAQAGALNVENKVRELNIGGNRVAIALIAQSKWMASVAAVFMAIGQCEVYEEYIAIEMGGGEGGLYNL